MTDTQHSTLNTPCVWMGESWAWNVYPSTLRIPIQMHGARVLSVDCWVIVISSGSGPKFMMDTQHSTLRIYTPPSGLPHSNTLNIESGVLSIRHKSGARNRYIGRVSPASLYYEGFGCNFLWEHNGKGTSLLQVDIVATWPQMRYDQCRLGWAQFFRKHRFLENVILYVLRRLCTATGIWRSTVQWFVSLFLDAFPLRHKFEVVAHISELWMVLCLG